MAAQSQEKSGSNLSFPGTPPFDLDTIRSDFPTLLETVHGKPLVYLDNAATGLRPLEVVNAIRHFHIHENANIHRGVHLLSMKATQSYEKARDTLRDFIGAAESREVVFVRGTTEGINLVAQSFVRPGLVARDEILIGALEHHSNIVPWQMLCEEKGAVLRVIPMNPSGELVLDDLDTLLTERTKILSIGHVSNALGTITPVKELIDRAHKKSIPVLVDGAQAIPHMSVNVRELDCDFYTFSGHKLFGPTGVGVLYGKADLLEGMPPWQGGGDMIKTVSFEKTTYNDIPHKFEAGTPHIAGTIGLGAAVDYVTRIGLDRIKQWEHQLLEYATTSISEVGGIRVYGMAVEKAAVLSFDFEEIHPHDIGTILDHEGIAIRAGHHCAQPVMQFYGVAATARASFAFYNSLEDVDALVHGLHKVKEVFS